MIRTDIITHPNIHHICMSMFVDYFQVVTIGENDWKSSLRGDGATKTLERTEKWADKEKLFVNETQ